MNKILRSIAILVVACCIIPVKGQDVAPMLHAIICCNTTDANIGEAMVRDRTNISNMIQTIATSLDCAYEEFTLVGADCTRDRLTQTIKSLEVGRDDVVFFFYGGHGSHAMNNREDPFPQMCMNTNIESLWMPVASVDRLIGDMQPKLRVIVTNCCNAEQPGVSIKPLFAMSEGASYVNELSAAAYKKLFFDVSGKVMITSSKLGQLSWCGKEVGGMFTCDFIDVIDAVGQNKIEPNWEAVCKEAYNRTSGRVIPIREYPFRATQEPYYTVDLKSSKDNNDKKSDTRDTDNLFDALQTLVNKNLSVDERLGMIQDVMSKFFAPGAKVRTVGRNATTVVDYEDTDVFLRRIVLSPFIKQINLLEYDKTGRNSEITVHEVRIN